ncbi:hypothetical protein MHUMG1_06087 [Metarhizium humberi]|uniref:Uncharacterized protein n=1 Tax=Metarhizium humberi TaxID=2596975 RepID=A0A9P8M9U7_9HYPO|nr:hypothetical protein MHUMG1_06087 [Metarhizium humberi]
MGGGSRDHPFTIDMDQTSQIPLSAHNIERSVCLISFTNLRSRDVVPDYASHFVRHLTSRDPICGYLALVVGTGKAKPKAKRETSAIHRLVQVRRA